MPPLRVCGDGAEAVSVDPAITVDVNGVAAVLEKPRVNCRPAGREVTVTGTVRGSSRRLTVVVRPSESVAVRRSSRCDGYSWSSATKDPVAPLHDCTGCAWHWSPSPQWFRITVHSRADADNVPSWASVAEPETEIRSPTRQVVPAVGVVICGCGAPSELAAAQLSPTSASPVASVHSTRTSWRPALSDRVAVNVLLVWLAHWSTSSSSSTQTRTPSVERAVNTCGPAAKSNVPAQRAETSSAGSPAGPPAP